LITNYLTIVTPLRPIIFPPKCRLKKVRVTHLAIPSPKYFTPLSPIRLMLRTRFKEVRVAHLAIPSTKYFAPLLPILLL